MVLRRIASRLLVPFAMQFLLASIVALLVATTCKAVPLDTELMFGIDVRDSPLGPVVELIHDDRPISSKVRVGDRFYAYSVIGQASRKLFVSQEQLDDLKRLLSAGQDCEVTLLRPDRTNTNSQRYLHVKVVLTAADLMPLTRTNKETRWVPETKTREFTVMTQVPAVAAAPTGDDAGFASVRVFYGTDRRLENGHYGGVRNDLSNQMYPVQFGYCDVSIPHDHRMGELEGPKWWRFERRENPQKHVVLLGIHEIGAAAVRSSIEKALEERGQPEKRRLLVFVHGFNVSFEDAARRTAQIHYDLDFQGISLFYSWPANGSVLSYPSDRADIAWSVPHIRWFLQALESINQVDEVFVIAHSMGTEGATKALVELAASGHGSKIREVILAAPDIDAAIFSRDIAPKLSDKYSRTTLYASSNDRALPRSSSEWLNGAIRAGEIVDGLPTVRPSRGLEVIDASEVKTDFLGHSYVFDDKSILTDVYNLLDSGKPAARRQLLDARSWSGSTYWRFRP